MGQLEHFILVTTDGAHALPVLVRAALAHVQLETIHPFLDGNGRLGRLLIVLMLIDAGVLQQPLLYLSLFFKQHRNRYYELLNGVPLNGDWEAWIDFFLEGVESTATAAATTAHRLLALFRADESGLSCLGRSGPSVRLVFAALCRRPLNSNGQLSAACDLSFPTTSKSLEALVKLGIAREITGGQRNRVLPTKPFWPSSARALNRSETSPVAILQRSTERSSSNGTGASPVAAKSRMNPLAQLIASSSEAIPDRTSLH